MQDNLDAWLIGLIALAGIALVGLIGWALVAALGWIGLVVIPLMVVVPWVAGKIIEHYLF